VLAYWALFGIFGFAAAMTNEQRQHRPSFVGWLAAGLFLTIVIGLRREVGGDWFGYVRIFERLPHLDFGRALTATDPAYAAVNLLAAKMGLDLWAVNLACAAIFTFGLLRLCRDQPNPVLAVLIGIPYLVIVVAMGYTRQGAALGLVMLALFYYFRGWIGRMALALALAVAFHKSAILVIPLIALASSRRRLLTFLLLGVIAATTYWLFIATTVDRLMLNYVVARYGASGAGIRIAMNLVPATIFLLNRKRFTTVREESRLWTIFSIGSFVSFVFLMISPSSAAVDRSSLFLIPLQLFVLSRIPVAFSDKTKSSIPLRIAVILYSLLVQFIWLNYADNARDWIPYHNYLSDMIK
jgi:hypothetical protein